MDTKWMLLTKKADFAGIGKELGVDPVVVRIMRNRGMETADKMRSFLDGDAGVMHDPKLLPDMVKATAILVDKIREHKSIRIIGDYDVDGVTATYVLYKGLKSMGAEVSYAIPDRITDGYGINPDMVSDAHDEGVDTIVTCDNGIAAFEAIGLAKELCMTCIVTDHHEVPYDEDNGQKEYRYPAAEAIVDPKRPDSEYPYREICGAMVAYKLILALDEYLADMSGDDHAGLGSETTDDLMQMAGLATVCDMMELCDENRVMVKKALKLLDNTKNTGLLALKRVCGIDNRPMSTYIIGFVIGPCINSTGRLEKATMSLELLLCDDYDKAATMATTLKQLNDVRKSLTEEGAMRASDHIKDNDLDKQKLMIIYIKDLHESVAGIVAGRIKEAYHRPVIVFTDSEDGIKGSGRSVDAYDMYENLSRYRDMYVKFGGHKMAAGLTVKRERFDEFREQIVSDCTLTDDELTEKIYIDAAMPFSYVTKDLIEGIGRLEPFGIGNSKPVFAQKDVVIKSMRILGKNKDTCKIKGGVENKEYELILFKGAAAFLEKIEEKYGKDPDVPVKMDVLYYPDINTYNGLSSIQFVIQDYHI